jgi:hypothetical protein
MVERIVFAIGALVGCAHTSPPPPPAAACVEPPGDVLRWAAAVCEYRAETDDFENEAVAACMATLPPKDLAQASACEQKRAYKAEVCKRAKLDDAACATFVPAVVEHGVGG